MTVILGEAMLFALKAHGDQTYGRKPYHVHLLDVVNVLRRFHDWDELSQDLINAAWLHDVVEDTDVTIDEVYEQFGERVAELVGAVTKDTEADNRKEAAERTYPAIRHTSGAIVLKLADRIANVENCISHDRLGRKPGRLFNMYSREHPTFLAELHQRCRGETAAAASMWAHLDSLIAKGHRHA